MCDPTPHRCRLPNVRDVSEQHGHIPSRRDHGAAKVVNALRSTECADCPLDRALRHDAARCVQVRFLDGVHHIVQADAPRGHALGIDLHLELPQVAAKPFHGGHAGNGQESVVHVELGEIPQRHEIGRARVGLECELEDLVQAAGQARNQRRIGAGGKLTRDLSDSLGHELPGAIVVSVRLELDRDLRHTELRVRTHTPHVRQPCERDLEGNRDSRLEFLRAHGRVLRDDVEYRRRQVGEHIPLQILYPEPANRCSCCDQQRGQEWRVERIANQSANHGDSQWAS